MSKVFPDLAQFDEEAEALTHRPGFDAAMRRFARDLARFHAMGFAGRSGVVDTVSWAVAILVLYFERWTPRCASAGQLVTLCAEGELAGATAVRNAIARLRQGGMIAIEPDGRALRLCPKPALVAMMQENLSIRLTAIEPMIPWPAPAREWARAEGVLSAFVRGNVEAYRRDRYVLFSRFPEIRAFMDRHNGYHILLDALARLEPGPEGASAVLPLTEIAESFAVSRAHVRKLFFAATAQGYLTFEAGGRLCVPPVSRARYRLWFGYEFAWARRLVGKAQGPNDLIIPD